MNQFQKNNLLRFLDRVPIKGIDEANAFMELIQLINQDNTPFPDVVPQDMPNLRPNADLPSSPDTLATRTGRSKK